MTIFPYNVLTLLSVLFVAYLLSEIKKGEALRHFLFLSQTQFFCWSGVFIFVLYETLAASTSLPCLPSSCRFLVGTLFLFLLSFSIFKKIKEKEKNVISLIGLWLIIASLLVAANDTQIYRMLVTREANDIGFNEKKEVVQMPFRLQLLTVTQDFHSSGKPKTIETKLRIQQNGISEEISISPNHPASCRGYDLYLQRTNNAASAVLIVRQPWKYVLYIGFTLLLAGCFIQIIHHLRKREPELPFWKSWQLIVFLLFAVVFCLVNLIFPKLFPWDLPPILQSAWFIPHIIAYLFAYALLLLGGMEVLVFCFHHKEKHLLQSDSFIKLGNLFFIIGLTFGALWAKVAWGDFWNWDAKEMWALTTLALCHGYMLARKTQPEKQCAFWLLLLTLLALQMCWYGVNFLPDAINMHLYN